MDEAEARLWEEYSATHNVVVRDKLAGLYTNLVYKIASKFAYKKPTVFEFDDIVQEGMLGLLDAIEKFDPSKGFQFSTYAQIRVRGAIIDGINALDWTPRRVKKEIRAVLTAIEKHGSDDIENISEETGYEVQHVRNTINSMPKTFIVPMDFESLLYHSPATNVEHQELAQTIKHAIDTVLTIEEQEVTRMSLLEGYPNTEISRITNYPLKDVKRLRDSAIEKLRHELDELNEGDG